AVRPHLPARDRGTQSETEGLEPWGAGGTGPPGGGPGRSLHGTGSTHGFSLKPLVRIRADPLGQATADRQRCGLLRDVADPQRDPVRAPRVPARPPAVPAVDARHLHVRPRRLLAPLLQHARAVLLRPPARGALGLARVPEVLPDLWAGRRRALLRLRVERR